MSRVRIAIYITILGSLIGLWLALPGSTRIAILNSLPVVLGGFVPIGILVIFAIIIIRALSGDLNITIWRKKRLGPPLIAACQNGHRPEVVRLINEGAPIHWKDRIGYTSFMWACHGGHKDVAEFLLQKGASVYAQGDDGTTALMIAVRQRNPDLVKLLLIRGKAARNIKDRKGITALMMACQGDCWDEARLLLDSGANANAQDREGETALMMAVQRGNRDLVKLLLTRGKADPNIKNRKGTRALKYATKRGYEEIEALLLNKGAKKHFTKWIKDKFGGSILTRPEYDVRRVSKEYEEKLVVGFVGPAASGKSSAIRALSDLEVGLFAPGPRATAEIDEWPLPNGVMIANMSSVDDVAEENVRVAKEFLDNTDVFIFLVNADGGIHKKDKDDLELLKRFQRPLLVLLSKFDLLSAKERPEVLQEFIIHQRKEAGMSSRDMFEVAFEPLFCAHPINLQEVKQWIDDTLKSRGKELLREKQMSEIV